MIAFKGFNEDMTCTMGNGVFQYHMGETIREEKSKCVAAGLHCAEYVLDCMSYYPFGQKNRYCLVEAKGSLDEDGHDTKIACTELTILRELTNRQIAGYAMAYMVRHPLRDWKKHGSGLDVGPDKAEGNRSGAIAIARGVHPRVRGAAGAILGLMVEPELGLITDAKLFEVGGDIKPDTWYTLENREPKEVAG